MAVGGAQYQSVQCAELGRELSSLNERIAALSAKQRSKRLTDVGGWIFLVAPVASLISGDLRPEIALHKGERDSIERVMASRCTSRRS